MAINTKHILQMFSEEYKKKDRLLVFTIVAAILLLPVFAGAAGTVNDSGGNWTVFDYGGGVVNDSNGNWTTFASSGGGVVNDSNGNWTVFGLVVVEAPTEQSAAAQTPVATSSTSTASSASGSGGGGAGLGTGAQSTTSVIGDVKAGESKTVTDLGQQAETGIVEITFETAQPAKDVKFMITSHKDKPDNVGSAPQNVVYKYVDLSFSGLSERSITRADISFRVEKSWLEESNVDKTSVRLLRYKDSSWQKLTTDIIRDDSKFVTYKARTPGFSTFVMVAEKRSNGEPALAEAVAAEESVQTPTAQFYGPGLSQLQVNRDTLILFAIIVVGFVIAYIWNNKSQPKPQQHRKRR